MFYPSFLSSKLQARAINLSHLGVHECAWKRDDAYKVIEECRAHLVSILGGDVLMPDFITQELDYTYDSWYIESEEGDNVVDSSCDYAKERIGFYSTIHAKSNPERVPVFILSFGKISVD